MVELGGVGCIANVAGIVAFDDEFLHAVAIHITQRNVVDDVFRCHHIAVAVGHGGYGDVDVLRGQALYFWAAVLLHATHHGGDAIDGAGSALRVGEVGYSEWGAVHLDAIAVEVVACVVVFFSKDFPTYKTARA